MPVIVSVIAVMLSQEVRACSISQESSLPGIQGMTRVFLSVATAAEELNWCLSVTHRQIDGRWVFKGWRVGNRAEWLDAAGAGAPVGRTGGGRVSASCDPAGQPQGGRH